MQKPDEIIGGILRELPKVDAIGLTMLYVGMAVAWAGEVPKPQTTPYSNFMPLHALIVIGVPVLCAYLAGRIGEGKGHDDRD